MIILCSAIQLFLYLIAKPIMSEWQLLMSITLVLNWCEVLCIGTVYLVWGP